MAIRKINKNYFRISALCFLLLQVYSIPASLICVLIGWLLIIRWHEPISEIHSSPKAKMLALPTSISIVLTYYRTSHLISEAKDYNDRSLLIILSIFCALLCLGAIYFLYVILSAFYTRFAVIFRDIVSDITKTELRVYTALFLIVSICIVIVYAQTDAFYNGADVIYTGDSGLLVDGAAFTRIFCSENDIRQPLFAVFSMPFTGLFAHHVITLQISQIALFIFSIFTLAKCMQVKDRIAFVLFFSTTYTFMLFTLMIEQYIIVFFWLTITIYAYCFDEKWQTVYASAGTMITSGVLFPLFGGKDIKKTMKMIGSFAVLICAFGQLDIIATIFTKAELFSRFIAIGGKAKLLQYSAFVKDVFYSPTTTVKYMDNVLTDGQHISWQLADPKLEIAGIIIFALTIIGIIALKNRFANICMLWIALSLVIMVGFGWGAAENGFILYSLYFGWVYIAVMYIWLEKLLRKGVYVADALLLVLNVPCIKSMVDFAINR